MYILYDSDFLGQTYVIHVSPFVTQLQNMVYDLQIRCYELL